MTEYVEAGGLKVARVLSELVERDIAPGTDIDPGTVWDLLGDIVRELGPRNHTALDERDRLQNEIDRWLETNVTDGRIDGQAYRAFLEDIGYLVAEGGAFEVATTGVDPEIASIAGPQLVVPVDKARYALNAANARWGSLYDALYGTDVIPKNDGAARGAEYNPERGRRTVEWAASFLDRAVPFETGSWRSVTALKVGDTGLEAMLDTGEQTRLARTEGFAGFNGSAASPTALLMVNNGLHIEIAIDPTHPIGRDHPAGIKDIVLEAAVSTIMDCEDSVAAVDAEDKAVVYRNWAGIMQGKLETEFTKAGKRIRRQLNADREYLTPDGNRLVLPGRSMLLIRHVGSHVMTHAVTTPAGDPIPETYLDAVLTTLAALHDLKGRTRLRNSRKGSMYIVKPKQHGPTEVALSVELFARVEAGFGLPANTLKIGIMDEERRTTVNLKECIRAAKDRVIFINTGFLDRTGDEIHTHMRAGPMIPKPDIKSAPWMLAYEDWNVDIGLETRLPGHAQIGKGMWAMPAEMAAMLETKQGHPDAGASCAWVPSPTAATLHAVHYHRTKVADRQHALAKRPRASLADILTPPLLGSRKLDPAEIARELDNNAQGILGYVVRWVEQGIGCSTVPDINDVGLMEDRATLRISSQHIANWLLHGLVSREQLIDAMKRMAMVVDRQNQGDPDYRRMAPKFDDSVAFQAALDLVFNGLTEPNGYTEHVLARRRREFKTQAKR